MPDNSTPPTPPGDLLKPRVELFEWLSVRAPPLAELYKGALRMLCHESPFPARGRYIAHSVREIRNRLPDFIAGPKGGGRLDYTTKMDGVSALWKKRGVTTTGAPPKTPVMSIPMDICVMVEALIVEHDAAREKPAQTAERLFAACAPESSANRANLVPQIQLWLDVTRWFEKRAHEAGMGATTDWTDLVVQFELFEKVLMALSRGFFETTKELNEILEDANS